MIDNLSAAKVAIAAEILHTKKGLDHYASRLASLQKSLTDLENIRKHHQVSAKAGAKSTTTESALAVSAAIIPATPASKSKAKKSKKKVTKAKATPAKQAAGKGLELPPTGGSFWPSLISSQPRSANEIRDAAVANIGFQPTPAQMKQLVSRQTFSLNALVKSKKIQDSGAGRDRRFFKK